MNQPPAHPVPAKPSQSQRKQSSSKAKPPSGKLRDAVSHKLSNSSRRDSSVRHKESSRLKERTPLKQSNTRHESLHHDIREKSRADARLPSHHDNVGSKAKSSRRNVRPVRSTSRPPYHKEVDAEPEDEDEDKDRGGRVKLRVPARRYDDQPTYHGSLVSRPTQNELDQTAGARKRVRDLQVALVQESEEAPHDVKKMSKPGRKCSVLERYMLPLPLLEALLSF